MTSEGALERRYRRLLGWYPAEHRRRYGEEMIGVLMAASPRGSRRPGLAGAFDLIWGGLRARFTGGIGRVADADWPDALAICSVAIPAILLGYFVADWLFYLNRYSGGWGRQVEIVLLLLAIVAPSVLALRYRRTALVIAFGLAIWLSVSAAGGVVHGYLLAYGEVICGALALLTGAVALAFSAGPRRALAVLTWRSWVVLAGSGVAMGLVRPYLWQRPTWLAAVVVLTGLVMIAAAILLTVPRSAALGLLILLAVPGYPGAAWAIGLSGSFGSDTTGFPSIVFLPTVLFACLAIVTVTVARSRRGSGAAISGR